MAIAVVEQLCVYPVKSMAGLASTALAIERRGARDDRRWMVVDERGRFVTGRVLPSLVRCEAAITPDGLALTMDGETLEVARPSSAAPICEVVVWRDRCPARDAGQSAADWLSARFGRPLRLVWQGADQHRLLPPEKSRANGDEVSFADGYPLLLIGSASLDDLNGRLRDAVSMAHFRPNVVVRTDTPFVEDGWREIAIGDTRFAVASRCSRCIFTTVDPRTGVRRADGEPLVTLRGYRSDPDSQQIMFGVNLIPIVSGSLAVGDALREVR